MKEFGKVAAGIGALIALGLILSHYHSSVDLVSTIGDKSIGMVRALSLQDYQAQYAK